MDRQYFLYIGPHRSSSTFQQTYIFPNITGVFAAYARDPFSNHLIMDAMNEHPLFFNPEDWKARLEARLEKVEEKKILLSNEEFFGDYGHYNSDGFYVPQPFYDHTKRMDCLKRIFSTPKVILTPRRQDFWVESAYMHFIHNFHTIKVADFFNEGEQASTRKFKSFIPHPSIDERALDWSVYVEGIYRTFGQENVLVVPQEVVLHDLRGYLDRLYRFMDVEPYYPETVPHPGKSMSKAAWRLALLLNRFVATRHNRFGFLPIQPGASWVEAQREKKDSRLLWLLAGITRRIDLFWILNDVVSNINYKKPDILGPERRARILSYYRESNRRYANLIGFDLEPYGYY